MTDHLLDANHRAQDASDIAARGRAERALVVLNVSCARDPDPGQQLDLDDELESWEDWFASLPPVPPVDDDPDGDEAS